MLTSANYPFAWPRPNKSLLAHWIFLLLAHVLSGAWHTEVFWTFSSHWTFSPQSVCGSSAPDKSIYITHCKKRECYKTVHQSDSSQVQNFVQKPIQLCYDIIPYMQKGLHVITQLVTALTIILAILSMLFGKMQYWVESFNENYSFIWNLLPLENLCYCFLYQQATSKMGNSIFRKKQKVCLLPPTAWILWAEAALYFLVSSACSHLL